MGLSRGITYSIICTIFFIVFPSLLFFPIFLQYFPKEIYTFPLLIYRFQIALIIFAIAYSISGYGKGYPKYDVYLSTIRLSLIIITLLLILNPLSIDVAFGDVLGYQYEFSLMLNMILVYIFPITFEALGTSVVVLNYFDKETKEKEKTIEVVW